MTAQDVATVAHLDLEKYLGLWYEIGRLPLKYEEDGARDVTAEYSLDTDGSIRVDNRCLGEDGKPTQALGRAKPADDEDTARLTVSFLPKLLRWIPFTEGDYWVLKIDEAYTTALVGTPDRANLWLLARAPHIDARTEADHLDEARRQGFDLTDWIRPQQSGSRVTDAMLHD